MEVIKLLAVVLVQLRRVVWCNCVGQKWWQDMQKADAMKSKPVTINAVAAAKPATMTPAAAPTTAKPGTAATSAPAPAGRGAPAAGHGAGRAASTAGGRTAAARAGPPPSRGDVADKLILFVC